jgi:hypothetical protein
MSIIFDYSRPADTQGRRGWLSGSLDHLKTEFVVTRLMQNAAKALEKDSILRKNYAIRIWCSAANGSAGAGILRVRKGLHEYEGDNSEIAHFTMDLKTPDSVGHRLVPHTVFEGSFHLYCEIIRPNQKASSYKLKPIQLSYQLVPNTVEGARPMSKILNHAIISDAASVDSELR